MSFPDGQVLISDKDFEAVIKSKEYVVVYQGNVRIRPISTVIEYNQNSIKLADGTTILRSANKIRTLDETEKSSVNQ
ncbi:hypothetical protein ACFPES_15140 [Paenibacillus sp. GCM10023248]|uniref:hypothetical protein n=1 Tax=Bacillales TaxID=1385 RepID=UPI0023787957|nr:MULTISPECIES: hypothetical protein [Bacillales]MDD9268374.1 hypothetical protein [Paenibacillus sp. MAHUQ-63]MDR6879264.1 hypothetical protein [Bacillus sp. 3255]